MLDPGRTNGESNMSRRLTLDRTLRVAACFGAMLVAGCGGGGGGEAAPPELVPITTQNQVAVARATSAIFVSLGGVSDLPIAGPTNAAKARAAAALTKQALGKSIASVRAAQGTLRPLASSSQTEPCDFGGSVTITFDDRDNNGTPSGGDVLTMTFDQCRASDSSSMNGTLRIDLSGFSATHLTGLFTFSQLTATDLGYMSIVNGAANCVYNESTDPSGTRIVRTEMTVATGGLRVAGSTPGYSDTFNHDPGFRAVWKDFVPLNPADDSYSTTEMSGQVHVASLAGRIILTTDASTPMHDWWDQPYPDSGRVTIDGYRSHLRMTVIDVTTVRLDLDANDDGAFESTLNFPWTQLMP
jgi:hypothetical protein